MLGLVYKDQTDMTSSLEELTLCCGRSAFQQRNYHLEGCYSTHILFEFRGKIYPLEEGCFGRHTGDGTEPGSLRLSCPEEEERGGQLG